MSPYFLCYDCSRVISCQPDTTKCSSCSSSKGRILTDEEFKRDYNIGAIYLINSRTGKRNNKINN